MTGEPYALAGKRLVFTNWHYVRPASFSWMDARGNNVTVGGSEGPWGATMKRYNEPRGIRIVAQPAERIGPLLEADRPWENAGVSIHTMIHDGGLYRGWGTTRKGTQSFFCYFESEDGLNWKRPDLGLVEFDGHRRNNIIGEGGGTVFIDPAGPPAERYKYVTQDSISKEQYDAYVKRWPSDWETRAYRRDVGTAFAVIGAVSPDGLHWTRLPEPLSVEHSDTQLVGCYDPRRRKYVLYTRTWMVGEKAPTTQPVDHESWIAVGRRSIGRSESDDFRHFPLSRIILTPGADRPPSDVYYTNCRTTLPGAPDHAVMFPAIWHMADDTTSIELASSGDGEAWNFVPGGALLQTPPFGQWDGGCIFAHPNLLELADGRWVLPYTGYLFPHKYPRGQWKYAPGLAVWPRGRLVGLEAADQGEFATVAILPPGRKLRLNVRTHRAGGVLVEVAGMNGPALPGRSFDEAAAIVGDHPAAAVTWKGQDDLGHSDGTPIMLRFRMDRATIFSLEFA